MIKKILLPLLLAIFLLGGCLPPSDLSPPPTETKFIASSSLTPAPSPVAEETPMPLSAILNEIQGEVEAMLPGDSSFSSAKNGTVLPEKSQVMTLEESYARLDLSTGTIIRMAPLSLFTITDNEEMDEGGLLTRLHLIAGQLWVILTKGIVEIETPSGLASVHGSYMMVSIEEETQDTLISCLEGVCEVVIPSGRFVLGSGEKTRLSHFAAVNGETAAPIIERLTEDELREWISFNPEAREILPAVQATLAAWTPILDRTPILEATRTPIREATRTPIRDDNDEEPTRTPILDKPTKTPRR